MGQFTTRSCEAPMNPPMVRALGFVEITPGPQQSKSLQPNIKAPDTTIRRRRMVLFIIMNFKYCTY